MQKWGAERGTSKKQKCSWLKQAAKPVIVRVLEDRKTAVSGQTAPYCGGRSEHDF